MALTTASTYSASAVGLYAVNTSSTTSALANTGDTLVGASITAENTIENSIIVAGFDVKVAFANIGVHFGYQLSHNGTNWSRAVDISTDGTPNVTGVHVYLVDLTGVYAPYVRFIFNPSDSVVDLLGAGGSDNENVGTSGTLQLFYAYKRS